MPQIEGIKEVIAALQKKSQDLLGASYEKAKNPGKGSYSVIVGFETAYALYVHENLEAYHPIGQAKFLEQPAREYAKEFSKIVKTAMDSGQTLQMGLIMAGLRLQREAQLLVPVKYGVLKASAFTELEEES